MSQTVSIGFLRKGLLKLSMHLGPYVTVLQNNFSLTCLSFYDTKYTTYISQYSPLSCNEQSTNQLSEIYHLKEVIRRERERQKERERERKAGKGGHFGCHII